MGSRKGYIIDGIGVNMTTALATIFVFGLIVFIHELGHFITAKMSGMQVDEFAIWALPYSRFKEGKLYTRFVSFLLVDLIALQV